MIFFYVRELYQKPSTISTMNQVFRHGRPQCMALAKVDHNGLIEFQDRGKMGILELEEV